jgi:hypothetical protein
MFRSLKLFINNLLNVTKKNLNRFKKQKKNNKSRKYKRFNGSKKNKYFNKTNKKRHVMRGG